MVLIYTALHEEVGHVVSFFNFFFLNFVFREQWGRGKERRKERIPKRFHTISTEPDVGYELTNWELLT